MSTDTQIQKERAWFYLDRRLGEIDKPIPGHLDMAEKGMSYGARAAATANAEKAQEDSKNEREALEWVRTLVTKE